MRQNLNTPVEQLKKSIALYKATQSQSGIAYQRRAVPRVPPTPAHTPLTHAQDAPKLGRPIGEHRVPAPGKVKPTPMIGKAKPLFIGPRGGKWADAKHTIHWTPDEPTPKAAPERKEDKAVACGLCFQWGYRYLKDHPEAVLHHGMVTEPFSNGPEFPHAWVTDNGVVKDWQTMVAGHGGKFRGRGYPEAVFAEWWKPREIAAFTHVESMLALARTGHYGPWEKSDGAESSKRAARTKKTKAVPEPFQKLKVTRLPDVTDDYDNAPWPVIKRGMAIEQAEVAIRNQPIEHMLVVGADGHHIARVVGVKNQVVLQPFVIGLIEASDGEAKVTHNHPTGHPLSTTDIWSAVTDHLREMRAVGPTGDVFLIRRVSNRKRAASSPYVLSRFETQLSEVQEKAVSDARKAIAPVMRGRGWTGVGESIARYVSSEEWNEAIYANLIEAQAPILAKRGYEYRRIHNGIEGPATDYTAEHRAWQEFTLAATPKAAEPGRNAEARDRAGHGSGLPATGGLAKAQRGPFIGPRGGRWADPKHTIHYEDAPTTKREGRTQHSRDESERAKHVAGATRALKSLVVDPEVAGVAEAAKRRAKAAKEPAPYQIAKALKVNKHVQAYLDKWIGPPINSHVTSWRATTIYAMRDYFAGHAIMRDTVAKISTQASKGWQASAMAVSQAPLRAAVPPELLAYLPRNIVVDVTPHGEITTITDRFENEHFTLDKKVAKMRWLLTHETEIAEQVRADLSDPREETRLAALVTSIVMATGIRPGKEGNAATKKNEAGEKELIDTFGAITLELDHVQVQINPPRADLVFAGKKGTQNKATITDPVIVEALRRRVVQASEAGRKRLLVQHDGVALDYTALQRYFRERFGNVIAPTDFRKLHATREAFAALHAEQANLHARIRAIKHTEPQDVKVIVAQEIARTLEAAFARAQSALSHDSATTTRESYINPEVVFHLLSTGRLATDLRTAIMHGKQVLRFDPMAFVRVAHEAAALKKSGPRLRITAQLARKLERHAISI